MDQAGFQKRLGLAYSALCYYGSFGINKKNFQTIVILHTSCTRNVNKQQQLLCCIPGIQQQLFYSHYTGHPANWRILFVQSFIARKPLLMATSTCCVLCYIYITEKQTCHVFILVLYTGH